LLTTIARSCFQSLMKWELNIRTANIRADTHGRYGEIICTILLKYFLNNGDEDACLHEARAP
jgi:hypothetical protein